MTEINMTIEEIEKYLNSFPPGYKFDPSDEELIVEYLLRKVNFEKLPVNLMHDVNIYEQNPDSLAEKYRPQGSKGWYFFTSREKKYRNGSRPNRKAGEGFWKATGADKTIKRNNIEVGFRKALVFYKGRPPKGQKTSWIMHEFRLAPYLVKKRKHSSIDNMRLDDFILSRIYKKNELTPKDKSPREEKAEDEGFESQEDEMIEGESPKKSPAIDDINCGNNIYNTGNLPYHNVCTMVDNNGIPNVHIYGASAYNDDHNVKLYNPRSDNNVYTNYSYGDYPSIQPLIGSISTNELKANASISGMNVNPSTSYVGLQDWDPYDQTYGDFNFLEDLNGDYINNYFDHSILHSLLDLQNPTMTDADLDLNPMDMSSAHHEAVNMSNPPEQHPNDEIEVKDDLPLSPLAPQHTPLMEVHGSYP